MKKFGAEESVICKWLQMKFVSNILKFFYFMEIFDHTISK